MNYPANTQHWQPGDIVIHDADAKKREMLMKVTGYDPRNGECQTVYLHPDFLPGMNIRCCNDIRYLLNPSLFGLNVLSGGDAQ